MGILILVAFVAIWRSVALYQLSDTRGLPLSWGAWMPLLHSWTLGNIADHARKTMDGKRSGFRWLLMSLIVVRNAVVAYTFVLTFVLFLAAIFVGVFGIFSGIYDGTSPIAPVEMEQLGLWGWFSVGLILLHRGIEIWALYFIYRSCKPKFAPVATVLSLLPMAPAALLFAMRGKKDGLPVLKGENLAETGNATDS